MASNFEWDDKKDLENREKHGVSFFEAQHAFFDPKRFIAEDLEHSINEARFYCFGKVGETILTVRFTYRGNKIRIIALDTGERGKKFMNKRKIKYTDELIGEVKLVADFLPPPDQLVLKEETVKVTLALTKESIDFFKEIAREKNTHYQTMIRVLLEQYKERYRA